MASKKIYHEIMTDVFEIDDVAKTFSIDKSNLILNVSPFPWNKVDAAELSIGDKSTVIPRIRLISSESGKRCTFFMTTESDSKKYVFMPSIGSLMNKSTGLPHLRGWKIIIKK